jgi:hypothetical protein
MTTAEDVIFVGGCMRSGTTLVQRLLSAAPGASPMSAECQYMTAIVGLYETWRSRYDQFLGDFFHDADSFEVFSKNLVDQFVDVIRSRLPAASTLVLKNPELTYDFPLLSRWYPQAKFVVMMRDPRDTIASMMAVARGHRVAKTPSMLANMADNVERLADVYKSYYAAVIAAYPQFGSRLAFVRYEDLVAAPDRVLAELGRFTGLTLNIETLRSMPDNEREFWDRRQESRYSKAFDSPLWTAALSPSAIGRYAERLSPAQIRKIESSCADVGRQFGYW